MRHAKTWGGSMLCAAAMLGSASLAEAVDVQGTWDAKITCTLYPEGGKPVKSVGEGILQITQTGQTLAANIPAAGNFAALVSDDGVHTNKGIIGGGLCPNPGAALGAFGKVTIANTGDGGSMTLDLTGGIFVVGAPAKCHISAKRTSAADPGLTLCP